MSNFFLGFGKCSKFYIYIIASTLSNTLKDISLENTYVLKNKQLLQNIYKYLGYIIFGIIFFIFFKKNQRISRIFLKLENDQKFDDSNKTNNLIYYDNKVQFILSLKERFLLLIVCLIYVLYFQIISILKYLEFELVDFWTFDIVFSLLFMYLYYHIVPYKHQIYSMIFVAFIVTILLILASFCKVFHDESENIYQYKGTDLCIFVIIIFISLSFLIFFGRINGKIIMDKYFLSPYKIIIIIGIIGFIINLIISIIFIGINTHKKCEEKKEDDKDKYNIFCYNDLSKYFSSISDHKNYEIFLEILLTLFYIIFSFIGLLCELLIIKYLNPTYILWADNLYFEIIKIKDFIDNGNFFKLFIILQFTELFDFIGCLIYLELIELKCFGLNLNTKKNIMIRSVSDSNEYLNDDLSQSNDDEDNIEQDIIEIV